MRHSALARGMTVVPLCALVLLSGCGGGGTDDAAATTTATTSSTSAPASSAPATTSAAPTGSDVAADGATDAPPFPADTSTDTGEAVAGEGPTVVTGIRTGTQEGFGRVVFDISGTAAPGWDVAYTDAPTQAGSGRALEVPGTAYLRVTLTGITNPYEAPGVPEVAPGQYADEAGPVLGLHYDSVYEGQALAYVGLTGVQPFRVYGLSNPTRIVVDVQG